MSLNSVAILLCLWCPSVAREIWTNPQFSYNYLEQNDTTFLKKDTSEFLSSSQIADCSWLGQILSNVKLVDIKRKVLCLSTPAVRLLSTHFAHAFSELNLHYKNNVSNETNGDKLFLV